MTRCGAPIDERTSDRGKPAVGTDHHAEGTDRRLDRRDPFAGSNQRRSKCQRKSLSARPASEPSVSMTKAALRKYAPENRRAHDDREPLVDGEILQTRRALLQSRPFRRRRAHEHVRGKRSLGKHDEVGVSAAARRARNGRARPKSENHASRALEVALPQRGSERLIVAQSRRRAHVPSRRRKAASYRRKTYESQMRVRRSGRAAPKENAARETHCAGPMAGAGYSEFHTTGSAVERLRRRPLPSRRRLPKRRRRQRRR